MRVLTVDDSRTILAMLHHTLSNAGFEVLQAEDGQKGLDVLATETVDVVITDINAPGALVKSEAERFDIVLLDLGLDDQHLLKRSEARFGLALLAEAQDGVEQRQPAGDHRPIEHLVDRRQERAAREIRFEIGGCAARRSRCGHRAARLSDHSLF